MVFIIKNAAIDILSNLSIISGTFSSASFDATLTSRIFPFLEGSEAGDKWAGFNPFYMEQLEELLPEHGFKIEQIKYFDYPSDPWEDDNKGHIGFIATKI